MRSRSTLCRTWALAPCNAAANRLAIHPQLLLSATLQVTCSPAAGGNCKGPCRTCNPASDSCEPAAYSGTCTTDGGKVGHCTTGGDCQVRHQVQN